MVVMPGAGYLEMVLAASAATHGKPWNVCGAMLIEPLLLDKTPEDGTDGDLSRRAWRRGVSDRQRDPGEPETRASSLRWRPAASKRRGRPRWTPST